DTNLRTFRKTFKNKSHWPSIAYCIFHMRRRFIEFILGIASYESLIIEDEVKNCIPDLAEKFIHIPNGVSKVKGVEILEFKGKENIIITVGRIGTYQKNNQMMLEALSGLNLQDWKIYFIGPI